MTVTRRRNNGAPAKPSVKPRPLHQPPHPPPAYQAKNSAAGAPFLRRPDKHPWSIETAGSLFHRSAAFHTAAPYHCYPTVLGQSFWQFVCMLDQTIPLRRRNSNSPPAPSAMVVRGLRGSGKSYLAAATAEVLPNQPRSDGNKQARWTGCYIPDCGAWQAGTAAEQFAYFRLELLTALGRMQRLTDEQQLQIHPLPADLDHRSPEHHGCLLCVEPFTRLEQIRAFLLRKEEQGLHIVFILDQAEVFLHQPAHPMLASMLETMMMVGTVVFVVREEDYQLSGADPCGAIFKRLIDSLPCLMLPSRLTVTEMGRLLEILPCLESDDLDDMVDDSGGLLREVRWWTGAQASQLDLLFALPLGESFEAQPPGEHAASLTWQRRFAVYEAEWLKRVETVLDCTLLSGPLRNTLLIGLFAMALRVPLDWTDRYQVDQLDSCLRKLGPADWLNLIRTDCLNTFYHPTEGTVCLSNIPTAPSHAVHLALLHPKLLSRIAPTWEPLFNTVTQAMLGSSQICGEAKRRLVRCYLHARLYWYTQMQSLPLEKNEKAGKDQAGSAEKEHAQSEGKDPAGNACHTLNWVFSGEMADTGDTIQIHLNDPMVVPFAGVLPAWWRMDLILTAAKQQHQPVVFVPVSPRHWFFDLMIWLPTEKRLLALTTTPLVGTWIKEGSGNSLATGNTCTSTTNTSSSTTTTTTTMKQLQTPTVTMEAWREALRAAGLTRIGPVRCVVCKATDLMQAAGVKL